MSRHFHLFPRLDEYLRRIVWQFYFLGPRVYVIQEPGSIAEAADVIRLTCATFDAELKIQVPSYLHRDINRESRQVALGLKRRRMSIERILEPFDVDWENDWFYLCIPPSRWASVRGDWMAKIQKLALPDIPKSKTPEGDPTEFLEPEILLSISNVMNRCPSVKELSIVACDNVPMFAGTHFFGEDGKWCEHLQRDGSGSASWADCIRVNDQVKLLRMGSVYEGCHFFEFDPRIGPLERKLELVVRGRGEFADLPKLHVVNGEESGGGGG